jgi:hypothetical protein
MAVRASLVSSAHAALTAEAGSRWERVNAMLRLSAAVCPMAAPPAELLIQLATSLPVAAA